MEFPNHTTMHLTPSYYRGTINTNADLLESSFSFVKLITTNHMSTYTLYVPLELRSYVYWRGSAPLETLVAGTNG